MGGLYEIALMDPDTLEQAKEAGIISRKTGQRAREISTRTKGTSRTIKSRTEAPMLRSKRISSEGTQ